MPKIKKSLENFGDNMQYRFVKFLIENPESFAEIEPYINPKSFDDEGLVSILGVMKVFYEEKGRTPSYMDLEFTLKDTVNETTALDKAYTAFKKIKEEEGMTDGVETAGEIGMKLVREKETLNQLKNAQISISNSGYAPERLERIIEGLQKIEGTSSAPYVTPISMYNEIMNESTAERVPTGIKILDAQMNGGLPRGTTGLLIAGTGVGKTTLFSIMACQTALLGNKVLYIFFEDKDTDFCRKFYSNITGLSTDAFHKDSPSCKEAEDAVREIFKNDLCVKDAFTNNVRAMRLVNGETTVEMLKSKVCALIAQGWVPDVIFLDYIQCMKSSKDDKMSVDKEYATLDRLMKRLDAFAQEENLALWVAQQTNRDGAKKDSSDRMGNVQGSFRICQTATGILYLERDRESADNGDYNRINLYLDKMRGSSLAKWRHAYLHNGTCQIDLSCADTTGPDYVPF